jgi:hypothetical protein
VNARDAVRRLSAHQAGQPLPRGERRSIRVGEPSDALVLAFVRTGGESRPWGIAFGHPGEEPMILTVPEGRDRDLVAAMAVRFAPVLLAHLESPAATRVPPSRWEDLAPIRQIWLPNSSHLDMLQHIAYAYTFTRSGGEDGPLLQALGRTCSWLFREAHRAGSQHVIVSTAALRQDVVPWRTCDGCAR